MMQRKLLPVILKERVDKTIASSEKIKLSFFDATKYTVWRTRAFCSEKEFCWLHQKKKVEN